MSPKSKPTKRRLSIHGPAPAERKWTRIVEKWPTISLPVTSSARRSLTNGGVLLIGISASRGKSS